MISKSFWRQIVRPPQNYENLLNNEVRSVKLNNDEMENLQKITITNVLDFIKNNPDQLPSFGNSQQIFEQISSVTPNENIYYQTVLAIYAFLGQKVSTALHQAAGDVKKSIQRILQNTYRTDEHCDFSFHKIYSIPKENIDSYFSIN